MLAAQPRMVKYIVLNVHHCDLLKPATFYQNMQEFLCKGSPESAIEAKLFACFCLQFVVCLSFHKTLARENAFTCLHGRVV